MVELEVDTQVFQGTGPVVDSGWSGLCLNYVDGCISTGINYYRDLGLIVAGRNDGWFREA